MLNCVVLVFYSCFMYYIYTQLLIDEKEGEEKGKEIEGEAGEEREGKEAKVKEKQEEREKEKERKSEKEAGEERGKEGKRIDGEGEVEGEEGGKEGKRIDGEGEVEGEERSQEGKRIDGEGEVEGEERGKEGKRIDGEGEVEGEERGKEGKRIDGEGEVEGGERQEEGKREEEVPENREEREEKKGGEIQEHSKYTWKTSCKGFEMTLVNNLLLDYDWHSNYDNNEVYCTELLPSSSEYVSVCDKITTTLICNITRIDRIENPFLLGCYLLKKQEYLAKGILVEERELFHCTSMLNISNIVRNNFDWRKTVRGKFGRGVSFSPFARYANKFANDSIGNRRAMILTKVLIGDVANGWYSTKIPPLGYDTTCGNNNRVFVKFCDYEFYPMFVAYYSL